MNGYPKQTRKILILAAIPHDLRLDKEIREIEEAIRRALHWKQFEIKIRTAIRPKDIRRALAEERPSIVHFCGHGTENGSLVLEDDGGEQKLVAAEGLAELFKLHSNYVNCVLLNTCYSETAALEISQHINYAIGMNQPISDRTAIVFAQGFYDGLGYENSDSEDIFKRAFDEGLVAIQMEELSSGSIPVLKKNFRKVLLNYTPTSSKALGYKVIGSIIVSAALTVSLIVNFFAPKSPRNANSTPTTTASITPSPISLSSSVEKLAQDLQAVNISFSARQLRNQLDNSYSLYPQFANGCLKFIKNRRLKQELFFDMIFWNYTRELGGKLNPDSPDGNLEPAILKAAMVTAHNGRYSSKASSFEDIVEPKQ